MARNVAGRLGWTRGSEDELGKGQRDVQPGCTQEGCDFGRDAKLIDSPHEDNLPVQPVAQRPGTKRSRQRLLAAHPRTSFKGIRGISLETELGDSIIRRR
jgi:hypothetical protein